MTVILNMTEGAKRMAETDPHGFTLALIAVTTVFTALVILYFVYSLIGKLSQPSAPKATKVSRKKAAKGEPDADTAAAIAMALEAELGGEVNADDDLAAIAMALHLHLSNAVHDVEPGIITYVPRESAWGTPSLNFRKTPKK